MGFSSLLSRKKSPHPKEPKASKTSSSSNVSKSFTSSIRRIPEAIISVFPFQSHGTRNLKPRTTPSIKKGLPSENPPPRRHQAQPFPTNSPRHTRPRPRSRIPPSQPSSRTTSGIKLPSQKPNLHKCYLSDEALIHTYTRQQISTSNQYKLSHPSLRRGDRQSRAIFSAIVNNSANLRLQLREARQELRKLQERQASQVEWLARVGMRREAAEEMRKRHNEVAGRMREMQMERVREWLGMHRLDPGRVVRGMRMR